MSDENEYHFIAISDETAAPVIAFAGKAAR